METQKVITRKNLPSSLPLPFTMLVYLYLDRFNPAEWVWGVVATVLVIIWLSVLYSIATENRVDIFSGKN
jgi:hypothetical protein